MWAGQTGHSRAEELLLWREHVIIITTESFVPETSSLLSDLSDCNLNRLGSELTSIIAPNIESISYLRNRTRRPLWAGSCWGWRRARARRWETRRGVTLPVQSQSIRHVLHSCQTEDLLLPLVDSGLVEHAGSQFEPVQRHFDGGQRTLPHDLLPAVLVEQSSAAHDTQEGHWGNRKWATISLQREVQIWLDLNLYKLNSSLTDPSLSDCHMWIIDEDEQTNYSLKTSI